MFETFTTCKELYVAWCTSRAPLVRTPAGIGVTPVRAGARVGTAVVGLRTRARAGGGTVAAGAASSPASTHVDGAVFYSLLLLLRDLGELLRLLLDLLVFRCLCAARLSA